MVLIAIRCGEGLCEKFLDSGFECSHPLKISDGLLQFWRDVA